MTAKTYLRNDRQPKLKPGCRRDRMKAERTTKKETMKYIIELEPDLYLLAYTAKDKTAASTPWQHDAKRFDNVYRAGDARDLMKKQHGFDSAQIVPVES